MRPSLRATHRLAISCATLLALPLTTTSCRRHELTTGVSDSTFVAAMAALRRLPPASLRDSATRTRARDSIMGSLKVTPAQLEQAGSALSANPERANAIWQAIERKQNQPRDIK